MTPAALATRLGFDPGRLRFAGPTAVAAALALVVSAALGLEHPQWSGMTVWAASQPSRGQLLEKSFFRFAGTVSGTTAGVLLVWLSNGRPAVVVVGLAVWIGLCAGIGNLQRGFVSYGTMLAGYSAAMVALLDTAHPDEVWMLGFDRLATVLVGVVVAVLVGFVAAPPAAEDTVVDRVRRLAARLVRDLGRGVDRPLDRFGDEQHRILSEMAAIEEGLEPHGAGSLRSRRRIRTIRALLIAEVAAVLWLRRENRPALPHALADVLAAAADALEAGDTDRADRALAEASALAAPDERLARALADVAAALAQPADDGVGFVEHFRGAGSVVLHRDWIGAREALVRAASTLLVVGGLWVVSGWTTGPFLLLGVAIMTSLFSTFDDPARFMGNVLAGQMMGAAGALACHWLVWPHLDGETARVAAMIPFVLLGVPIVSHRRTLPVGFDYNMVLLLLLQPGHPGGTFAGSLAQAGAVAAGPIIGFGAYRLLFPVDARRRLTTLVATMVHDLADMAASPDAPAQRRVWRARLYHRLLRLVRFAEKSGERRISVAEGALAVLELGSAVLRLHEARADPATPAATRRAVDLVLGRIARLADAPEPLARGLDTAARRLARDGRDVGDLVRLARTVRANRDFFRLGAGPRRPAIAHP